MIDFFCFFFWVLFFSFYCLWFKTVGFRLWWIFFFLIWVVFFHFIAFGLSLLGLDYDGFFLFFDLGLLLPCYCLWFKSVGFRLWWIFVFFIFIWAFFFHFIALGLSPSDKAIMFFFFFDLGLLLPFYCPWFKSVGFRLWGFFFVFSFWHCFFHFLAFGLSPSGLVYDEFFLFFWFGSSTSIFLPLVKVRRV